MCNKNKSCIKLDNGFKVCLEEPKDYRKNVYYQIIRGIYQQANSVKEAKLMIKFLKGIDEVKDFPDRTFFCMCDPSAGT